MHSSYFILGSLLALSARVNSQNTCTFNSILNDQGDNGPCRLGNATGSAGNEYTIYSNLTLVECEAKCLADESCLAFEASISYTRCEIWSTVPTNVKNFGTTWACKVKECSAIDGMYSEWSNWGDCSKTCDSGVQERARLCNNPIPEFGGANCEGLASETQTCNEQKCPVDGGFSTWSGWGECSKSCNIGMKTRERRCDNPVPEFGGKECGRKTKESKKCNVQSCPIDGGFSTWSSWGDCSKSCNIGLKTRERTCDSPVPEFGGKRCEGTTSERKKCNKQSCPIDGGFSKWSSWSTCSSECDAGTKEKTRSCTNPTPKYGGSECVGTLSKTKSCNLRNCTSCDIFTTPIPFLDGGSYTCANNRDCKNDGIDPTDFKTAGLSSPPHNGRIAKFKRHYDGPLEFLFGTPVTDVTVEIPYAGQKDTELIAYDCEGNVITSVVDPVEIDSVHFVTLTSTIANIARVTVAEKIPLYIAFVGNVTASINIAPQYGECTTQSECNSCDLFTTPIPFVDGSYTCKNGRNCKNEGIDPTEYKTAALTSPPHNGRIAKFKRHYDGPLIFYFGTPVGTVTIEIPYAGQKDTELVAFDCVGNQITSVIDPVEIDSVHFVTLKSPSANIAILTVAEKVPLYVVFVGNVTATL
eukprot:Awhi_evm1s6191